LDPLAVHERAIVGADVLKTDGAIATGKQRVAATDVGVGKAQVSAGGATDQLSSRPNHKDVALQWALAEHAQDRPRVHA